MTTTENISSLLQDLKLVDEDTHQHENQSSSRASCEPREEAGVQGVLCGNLEDDLVLSQQLPESWRQESAPNWSKQAVWGTKTREFDDRYLDLNPEDHRVVPQTYMV